MSLAVLRIRGTQGVNCEIQETMNLLHLHAKHYCSIMPDSPGVRGMLQKAKDYITFGTVTDETVTLLYTKRGLLYAGDTEKKSAFVVFQDKKYKHFFRLAPPRGGFERKGIKMPFTRGGVLGDRKEKMNDLIKKMI